MLIGAPASLVRNRGDLLHPDVIMVVLLAAPVIALGAPAPGYAIGAIAWIIQRFAAGAIERKLLTITELRQRLGWGVASSMGRVWMLACAIIAAAVIGEREDGLTAALVIFAAFTLYFCGSAFTHIKHKRSSTP